MSKRKISRDPTLERRTQYMELEDSGESQAALWQALEALASQGMDLGPKVGAILGKRSLIKGSVPK